MTYLRSRRPIANPHEGFMTQLEAFDVKLQKERAAAKADGQPPTVSIPSYPLLALWGTNVAFGPTACLCLVVKYCNHVRELRLAK